MLFLAGCNYDQPQNSKPDIDALIKRTEKISYSSENFIRLVDSIYNSSKRVSYKNGLAKAYSLYGNYFYSKSQFTEALEKYQTAVKLSEFTRNFTQLGIDYENLGKTHNRLKNKDESIKAFKKSALSREEINDSTGIGSSLNNVGYIFWQGSDFDSALVYFEKALSIRERLFNKEHLASTLNNMGTIYYQWSLYDKALEYYLRTLKYRKEIDDKSGASIALSNIGLIYKETSDPLKAIEYYKESLSYSIAAKDDWTTGYVYHCMGAAFNDFNTDSSLHYFLKSFDTYSKINYAGGEVLALKGIGQFYLKTNQLTEAKSYFEKILKLASEENIILRVAEAYMYLGEISEKQNNLNSAKKNYEKSIELSSKLNIKLFLRDCSKSLSRIYERTGNIGQALNSLKKYEIYKEEIDNEDMQRRLSDMKDKFEFEKYQKQLLSQQHENYIQKLYLGATIFIVLCLGAIALTLIIVNRRRQKINNLLRIKNEMIERQSSELSDKNKELLESNKAKDKLFSIIAHDLKNPFFTLLNYAAFLKDEYKDLTDDEKIEFINNISATTQKTYELLENLLDLSSAHTGRIIFNPENLELANLVNKVTELFSLQLKEKELNLKNKIDSAIKVFADDYMLATVVRNLVNNAIKYSNKGGCIEISAYENEKDTVIAVSDNGIGMDKNTIDNIFKLNVLQSQRGTSGEKGTGLGLGLCKEFIEKNSGQIFVESELERGSKFWFTVPKLNKTQTQ